MRIGTIVLAPDSFKETLRAVEAAAAMAQGVRRASMDIVVRECPVADGGEGTMETLVAAARGTLHVVEVAGPLGERRPAAYGIIDDGRTAIIEMAQASGLALAPPAQRDPTRTTSFGTGELIRLAAENPACTQMIVCIGGSATVDGGAGMAQGFGFRFFDRDDREIESLLSGGALWRISRFEPPEWSWPPIRVACDVANPLCGSSGAAHVYGPQKGATPQQVRALDDALAHLAKITGGPAEAPGAGAAGGAGFGLMTFFGAKLERGIDLVLDAIRFRERCAGADLVITGEGRLDGQSLHGKACIGVARAAADLGVPTIAIAGSKGPGADKCLGTGLLAACHSLEERFGRDRAMREAHPLLASLTEAVVREL